MKRVLPLERFAPILAAGLILAYVSVFAVASCLKFAWYGQGHDLVQHEQAIWNTLHGRIYQVTGFVHPSTLFGYDPFLIWFLVLPIYALLPSTYTLLILHAVVLGIGALPVYWLAGDLLGGRRYGVLGMLLYFLYPTLGYLNLDGIRARSFGMVFFLFAYYFYRRERFWPFILLGWLAGLCKVEIALVVACFGLYALIERRPWRYVVAPFLLGIGWFLLMTMLFVPWVNSGETITYVYEYYGPLGSSAGEILRTLVTRPALVAQTVFTLAKARYIAFLFLPLAGLPLLAPSLLVFTLPILGLNLLAVKPQLWDVRYWYQALLIPPLILGTLYAVRWLRDRLARRNLRRPAWLASHTTAALLLAVLAVEAVVNLLTPNPLLSLLRNRESPARVAAADEMLALIPPTARVAATGRLATHLVRQYLYYFPLADPSVWAEIDYFAVDTRASGLEQGSGRTMLDRLANDTDYRLIFSKEGFALYARITSPGFPLVTARNTRVSGMGLAGLAPVERFGTPARYGPGQ